MATKWRWFDDRFMGQVRAKLKRNMRDAVDHAEREVVDTLSGSRSGRTYTRFFYTDTQGRLRAFGQHPPHTASAPGEPPAVQSGNLRSSIETMVTLNPLTGVSGFVGTHVIYGVFLELGTEDIEPRPWLMKTIREQRDEITALILAA